MIHCRKRLSLLSVCIVTIVSVTFFLSGTATAAEDEWSFDLAPYVWMAAINGDLTVRGFESTVDAGFDDLVEVLDFGAIGHFEATKGRWTAMTDLVFLKVSEDGDTPGPVISDIDVEGESLVLEVGGAYRLRETESGLFNKPTSLSALAGVRYFSLDMDVDITATPAIADRSGSKDWVDPYVGARTRIQWTPRWSSGFRFDIGGFGVSSDFVYQFVTLQRIEINDRLDFVLGYRHLDYDYDDGSGAGRFEFDASMSGPLFGVNIKF